ncbi:hypothetical protein [Salinispira pacifica]
MIPVVVNGRRVGKPAGVRCAQLTPDNRCRLFGKPERPRVCVDLNPTHEMCGDSFDDAFLYLEALERATATVD